MRKSVLFLSMSAMLFMQGCTTIPDLSDAAKSADTAAGTVQGIDREILEAEYLGKYQPYTIKDNKYSFNTQISGLLNPTLQSIPTPTHQVSTEENNFLQSSEYKGLPSQRKTIVHTLATNVCAGASGAGSVNLTAQSLGTFSDAITTLGKVAAPTSDPTYAGYYEQFQKDHEAIKDTNLNPEDLKAIANKAKMQNEKVINACIHQFETDESSILTAKSQGATNDVGAVAAIVVAGDALIKAVLKDAETVYRSVAIKKTLHYTLYVMSGDIASLKNRITENDVRVATQEDMGLVPMTDPQISPDDKHPDALSEKAPTNFTNALSIHRWFLAQRIMLDYTKLAACDPTGRINTALLSSPSGTPAFSLFDKVNNDSTKNYKAKACPEPAMDDWTKLQTLDQLVKDADAYKAAAAVNPDKILDDLSKSVSDAQASENKVTLTKSLDLLSNVAGAISDVYSANASYRKARN